MLDIATIKQTSVDRLPPVNGREFLNSLRKEYSSQAVRDAGNNLREFSDAYNGNVGKCYARINDSRKNGTPLQGADQKYLIDVVQRQVLQSCCS